VPFSSLPAVLEGKVAGGQIGEGPKGRGGLWLLLMLMLEMIAQVIHQL
jgi:hypothetical protein